MVCSWHFSFFTNFRQNKIHLFYLSKNISISSSFIIILEEEKTYNPCVCDKYTMILNREKIFTLIKVFFTFYLQFLWDNTVIYFFQFFIVIIGFRLKKFNSLFCSTFFDFRLCRFFLFSSFFLVGLKID